MEEKVKCEICDREFKGADGLVAHNKAKHPEKIPKERRRLPVKKIRNWGILFIVLGLIIFGIYSLAQNSSPKGEDFSKAIPVLPSREHISSIESVEYNSNPPTSGPHYETPARPGFREEPIEDGYLIHSMEHGLVWISYHPRIGEESEKLRTITSPFAVITERKANDEDIAVASWGRLDTFNIENGIIGDNDLQRINDFIKRYADKGPEKIQVGQHGGI